MALFKRKVKDVGVVESDVMEAGELEVPKPGKSLREEGVEEYYMRVYSKSFVVEDFAQFHGFFESEVCKLLFGIFAELKQIKDKLK